MARSSSPKSVATDAAPSLRDPHIRAALLGSIREHDPAVAIFEELHLSRGERRADVVAVNGSISGYEIKSELDTLVRLDGQSDHYATVCEYMTIVLAQRHIRRARTIVPNHWGITVAVPSADGVVLAVRRKPKRNRTLDRECLIRLLWRDECARLLRQHGFKSTRHTPVIDLWARMSLLETPTILAAVRAALKARVRPAHTC